jgi:hypothetical protein
MWMWFDHDLGPAYHIPNLGIKILGIAKWLTFLLNECELWRFLRRFFKKKKLLGLWYSDN